MVPGKFAALGVFVRQVVAGGTGEGDMAAVKVLATGPTGAGI